MVGEPRALTPTASARHLFGAEVRRWRERAGWSLGRFAAQIPLDKGYLSKIEAAEKFPRRRFAEIADVVLDTGGALALLWDFAAGQTGRQAPSVPATVGEARPGEEEDDVERRALMQLVAALGAGAVVPTHALETLRHGLDVALPDRARTDLGEWERTADEYAHTIRTAPPARLIADLAADTVEVRGLLQRAHTPPLRTGLYRVSAQMSALMAMALHHMGEPRVAWRWWRTARRAADATGDADLRVWVRGKEAGQSLYGGRPGTVVIALADEARALAGDTPRPGLAPALAARTVALARTGRAADTRAALAELGEVFQALPSAVTDDHVSVFGWSEQSLRNTESHAYTLIADTIRAGAAAEAALACYPPAVRRGPAQVRLHQAACLIHDGDVTGGIRYASEVVTGLPSGQRTTTVHDVAAEVLTAVPARARGSAAVADYRALLTQN